VRVDRDRNCFVCGPDNPVGLKVTPEADGRGNAVIRLEVPATCQGWQGIVHGGILSTLFDEAAIYACMGRSGGAVTAEMTMRYLKPVPVERPIEVRARVVKERRRKLSVEGEILLDGAVHARGQATILLLKE